MLVPYLALSAILLALSLWGRSELARFLETHASLDGMAAFEDYKSLARGNMYGALAYLVIGVLSMIVGIVLVFQNPLVGLAAVIGCNVVLYFLGDANKKMEIRVRNLPCGDPARAEQCRQIGETWVHKPLPNF